MRTRDMYFTDYGISQEEVNEVLSICRKGDSEMHKLIIEACAWSNPDLQNELFYGIVKGVGYDDLCKVVHIPIGRGDYFGYRRKAIARIRQQFISKGIVKDKRRGGGGGNMA